MSRYEFESNGARVAIGWDRPLATFYLQVWSVADLAVIEDEDEDEHDAPQIWLGTSYGETPDHHPLLAIARHHVPTIPADLGRNLLVDQLREPPRPLAAGGNTLEQLLNTLAGHPTNRPTQH